MKASSFVFGHLWVKILAPSEILQLLKNAGIICLPMVKNFSPLHHTSVFVYLLMHVIFLLYGYLWVKILQFYGSFTMPSLIYEGII